MYLFSDESSPPEDEGISSSERSLSPDDDLQREPMVYEVFNVKNETILMRSGKPKEKRHQTPPSEISMKKLSDDEDETTIEEVIEELRNIINDAESEQYEKDKIAEEKLSKFNQKSEMNVSIGVESKNHSDLEKKDSITSTKHNIIITNGSDYIARSIVDSDSEIIPVKILPQPPRKSKSLVHLFIPTAQQGVICNNKNDSQYDDDPQYYSSDEGSDSLLSASRCQPQLPPTRPDKQEVYVKTNNRSLLNTIMDARERAVMAEKREQMRRSRHKSGEEVCRKQSIKRTESFTRVEQQVGIVSVDDLGKIGRDSFDGLFYRNEVNDSQYETLTRHGEKRNEQTTQVALLKQREDFAALLEAKKLTKSLDRIDEGLDSMVDIILTSENNRQFDWTGNMTKMHSNIDLTRDSSGNAVVRSPSKRRLSRNTRSRHDSRGSGIKVNQEVYEASHPSSDGSHRLFFPSSRVSSNSYEQHSQNNGSNTSFIIRRGHTNAGLYSGQNNSNKGGTKSFSTSRVMSVGITGNNISRALSPPGTRSTSIASNMNGLAKLTDIPSGLY